VSIRATLCVTAVWDNEQAYAGWRSHPIRDEMAPQLAELVVDVTDSVTIASGVYEIAVAASR
jgi:hypothetical protein